MTITETSAQSTGKKLAGKYLTFVLASVSYGIPVLNVREIIRLAAITAVPQMPAHIKGVINLRGKIIPVLDLCAKFGVQAASEGSACIVVVQVNGPANTPIPLGLIVDAVEEVSNFAAAEIEATPDFGSSIDTAYILGMAKSKGSVKTLLDIDRVVGRTALAVA